MAGDVPTKLPVPLSGESDEAGLEAMEDTLSFRFIMAAAKDLSR